MLTESKGAVFSLHEQHVFCPECEYTTHCLAGWVHVLAITLYEGLYSLFLSEIWIVSFTSPSNMPDMFTYSLSLRCFPRRILTSVYKSVGTGRSTEGGEWRNGACTVGGGKLWDKGVI